MASQGHTASSSVEKFLDCFLLRLRASCEHRTTHMKEEEAGDLLYS